MTVGWFGRLNTPQCYLWEAAEMRRMGLDDAAMKEKIRRHWIRRVIWSAKVLAAMENRR